MKFVDFKNNLKKDFLKVFPNSTIKVVAHNNLYKSIYIDLYFANKTEELSNGYLANDMFKISFRIDTKNGEFENTINDDTILPDNMVLKNLSNSVVISPSNDFLYCDYKKVTFRKTEGDYTKILNSLSKYFNRLHDTLIEIENDGLVHYAYKDLFAKKLH